MQIARFYRGFLARKCPTLTAAVQATRSLIQIGSARRFKLARDIDPAYGAAFDAARSMGVEVLAYRCGISCEGIEVAEPVSIEE